MVYVTVFVYGENIQTNSNTEVIISAYCNTMMDLRSVTKFNSIKTIVILYDRMLNVKEV